VTVVIVHKQPNLIFKFIGAVIILKQQNVLQRTVIPFYFSIDGGADWKGYRSSIDQGGDIVELINLAREQHEARLYRRSELTWQRVLKTQERLFGISNPALALSLLYMAHPVRNQRRIDNAMELVKRAELFVSKSRDPVLIARWLDNLAFDANFRKNYEAAAAYAEKAIAVLPDRYLGSQGQSYYALAAAKYRLKDYDGAEVAARKTLELFNKAQGFTTYGRTAAAFFW
jgi:tetratricopeptide (TPR) repeat protein